jgi:hypothetical protein
MTPKTDIKPATNENYFTELNSIDCSGKVEKKNGLSYLSWAYAWGELKKRYPESYYTIYENKDGLNYHTDGRTGWVKTGVTVVINRGVILDAKNGEPTILEPYKIEHIEYLPIMDYRNNSIPLDKITSFDVNKAIQRSLTKAVARHGLVLYIYAGEDLPEETAKAEPEPPKTAPKTQAKRTPNKIRAELVELCKANPDKVNLTDICKEYKLNNDAPDENFKRALDYVKFCLRVDEFGLGDLPEEV